MRGRRDVVEREREESREEASVAAWK